MIKTQKWITRADLQANPTWTYVFGDNEARWGLGGQAKEMRNEPNAFGIPTLHSPTTYWSDAYFNDAQLILQVHFDLLKAKPFIVWPADGIGTGLADLQNRAPKIWDLLQIHVADLFKVSRVNPAEDLVDDWLAAYAPSDGSSLTWEAMNDIYQRSLSHKGREV